MRRFALVALIPAAILLLTASLSARNNQPKYKTIEVKHFTKADGVDLSDVFINSFYDGLRAQIEKEKVADQVVADGAAVPDADAADSVVVEGRFTEFEGAHHSAGSLIWASGKTKYVVTLYRRSDHSVLKAFTHDRPHAKLQEDILGQRLGAIAAELVKQNLK
jgi:hypothetical protein